MKFLQNEWVRFELADNGGAARLLNRKSGREIVKPDKLWQLILSNLGCLEFEAGSDGNAALSGENGALTVRHEVVKTAGGELLPIAVELTFVLDREDLHCRISIENNAPDIIVRECHYPIFTIHDPAPPMRAATALLTSECVFDVPAWIRSGFTQYMMPDQKSIRREMLYPGRSSCSVNFFVLDWGSDALYYGCHDPEFAMCQHVFELENNRVRVFMARYPFLGGGKVWTCDSLVISPLIGDWFPGARKYRQWADSWFRPPAIPEFIRSSPGWQRIILRHQYGEVLFPYDSLERAYQDAAAAGIDTLFLFGWTAEGMDAGYPVYSADPAQGGRDALKKNIRAVQAQGGRVILYFNGQLIDAASGYYRNGDGQRVSIKREDGVEHRETYNFGNTGTWLRMFGNKTFVVACPSCREWIEILKRHIDDALDLGVDAVFFDQLGMTAYPCCDPSHGHPVPFTGLMRAKRGMLQELYAYLKAKNPAIGFGIECTSDLTADCADFIHISGNVAQVWNPDWRTTGEAPQLKSAASIFKAAFPEVILSNRHLRDESDCEFQVNQMLLLGSRSDVEIYRCRATIGETPRYKDYLRRTNQLREKFADILYNGTFSHTAFHSVDHPAVRTNSFRLGDKLVVIVTQAGVTPVTARITVPGGRLLDSGSVRDDVKVDGEFVTLPENGLAVLYYQLGSAAETKPDCRSVNPATGVDDSNRETIERIKKENEKQTDIRNRFIASETGKDLS